VYDNALRHTKQEFRRSIRGYNEAEVDEFLDEVMKDLKALQRKYGIER